MARITIGNSKITGFVNLIADGRFVVGTGSYNDRDGNKVFKESVTVFTDSKFDGKVPEKGKYVQISGDMVVSPRKDDAEKLNATMNVRFANQVEELEAPKAKAPAESAPAGDRDI